ncbi:unnamed protein product [Leuciscus chuanchicus]
MLEPSTSRSAPRFVMVARSVCPLWGDKWIPMRLINMIDRPIVLRRNTKIANVHPCLALEELDLAEKSTEYLQEGVQQNVVQVNELNEKSKLQSDYKAKLRELGLTEIDIESCEVSDYWKGELTDLIVQYESTFSRDKLDCGEVKNTVHRIRLKDEKPFRLPYRRVPPTHYQKLRQTLDEMEERGIIQKSNSEWASPLVFVWKPSGELRICTDFRWLNQRTEKDAYPLPHQADALSSLGGNCYFSTMDLTSGFYNIPIHEDDRNYTACTTPVGLYEYNRMAQGLCNSPATFSRMMTSIFGDQNFLSLLCYLDDLLVFGKTEREALGGLEMVFSRLKEHNLKLAQKKCYFLRRTVKFLGHIVTESGIATDPAKVSVISDIKSTDLMEADGKTPSPTKVKSFLGMANYYSHFIEGLSTLAKPLFKLTAGQKVGRRHGQKKPFVSKPRRLRPEDWTAECDTSVENIKHALSHTVVLAHPDFHRPFLLSTDASLDGFGAVLSQIPEAETKPRPVAFASKTLSKAQSNYPAHRLEFYALKWAVCDKFTHWLKGTKFTVLTDNNPLTYIMSKPKLDACEQRWVSKLAPFDFDLRYIPGTKNIPADLLSRRPFARTLEVCDALETKSKHVTSDTIQETFRLSVNVHHQMGESSINSQVEKLKAVSTEGVRAVFESCLNWEASSPVHSIHLAQNNNFVHGGVSTLPVFSMEDIRMKQKADPTVSRVAFFVERKRRPSRRERDNETAPVIRLMKHWEKLEVKDGVLYRRSKDQKDLREAVHIAKRNTTDAQRKQAQGYNKRSKGAPLEVGDRVLLVNKKERGKGKLADVWDSAVHVVIWKDSSLPIYRVENPTTKNSKVVHRNFLLPVNFLPLEEPDIESTVLSTVSEEEKDQTEDQRSLSSMGRESRSSRTAAWIFQGAAFKAPQSTGKCAVKTKEHVTELEKSVCPEDPDVDRQNDKDLQCCDRKSNETPWVRVCACKDKMICLVHGDRRVHLAFQSKQVQISKEHEGQL